MCKSLLKRLLTASVAGLCLAPLGTLAQDPVDGVTLEQFDYAAMAASIDATNRSLQALRSEIDRAQFDPESLLDTFDYDAAPALAFVREQIAYQPYDGVMRGVAGTLKARAGNSLDQSILLASLLKSAGFDARVVRGTLSDAEALRLLRSLSQADRTNSLAYLEPGIARHFGPQAAAEPELVALDSTALAATARTLADGLRDSLRKGGVELKPADVQGDWLPRAKAYFWVQHRDGPAQDWQDAHPAFGVQPPPAEVAPEEYFEDSVPEAHQHTLTVSAWVEQWTAGKISKHAIMTPWTRPVANLDSVAIRYRNFPSGLNLENAGDLGEVLSDTQIFIPMFNDVRAPGAMAFDLKGRVIDPMVLGGSSGGGAGLFATLGNLMEQATGDVQDRQDGQPVLALHSMWLEFTFTAPDGAARTQRRYVIAPRDDHAGGPESLLWPLITDHTYMVNAGGQPLDYLAERYLATAIENGAWLKAMVHKFLNPDTGTPMPDNDLPVDFPPLAQYWFMDDNPLAGDGVVAFRAQPGLLGLRRGFLDADTAFAGVDIVANHVEHLRITDSGVESAPAAALGRGVWETVLESLPQRVLSVAAGPGASAVEVFRLASEQGIGIRVVNPSQAESVAGLGLQASAAGFLAADLAQGYTVVAPERVPAGAAQAAWWRVDPASGETLGMTGDGHGQDVVEYLTEVTGIAFTFVQALQSLKECDKQENDVAKMCCLVEANINNVAGLGFGSLLGSVAGTAGAALFDVLNYSTQLATEAAFGKGKAQGLMPQASLGCDKMQATDW
jgi:hypothetical protein